MVFPWQPRCFQGLTWSCHTQVGCVTCCEKVTLRCLPKTFCGLLSFLACRVNGTVFDVFLQILADSRFGAECTASLAHPHFWADTKLKSLLSHQPGDRHCISWCQSDGLSTTNPLDVSPSRQHRALRIVSLRCRVSRGSWSLEHHYRRTLRFNVWFDSRRLPSLESRLTSAHDP